MVQWPFVPALSTTLSTQLSSRASYGEVRNGVTHFRLQGQAVGDHMTFRKGRKSPFVQLCNNREGTVVLCLCVKMSDGSFLCSNSYKAQEAQRFGCNR